MQFGRHTDTLKYCEYLRDRWRVTYLCVDDDLPRVEMPGIEVVYCRLRPLGKIELGLLLETLRLTRERRFDLVFLRRTKLSFMARVMRPRLPMIYDVRSGSIESGPFRRAVEDVLIYVNARFFGSISVISSGLADRLRLPRRAHVLPLGADPSPVLARRRPGQLRLVYVGTFKNRSLECTIEGLRAFLADEPDRDCRYTVIGFGSTDERSRLQRAVEDAGLSNVIQLRPPIGHHEIAAELAKHDVGIAFTPLVPWYEHQPSTKVYEYLSAGLLCIASDTAANREVITSRNGVLIEDSVEGVRRGLHWAAEHLLESDPEAIARSVAGASWSSIVHEHLLPLMERAIGDPAAPGSTVERA